MPRPANRKLTMEQVRAIRRKYVCGVGQRALAEYYGVCLSTICEIVNWRTYPDDGDVFEEKPGK